MYLSFEVFSFESNILSNINATFHIMIKVKVISSNYLYPKIDNIYKYIRIRVELRSKPYYRACHRVLSLTIHILHLLPLLCKLGLALEVFYPCQWLLCEFVILYHKSLPIGYTIIALCNTVLCYLLALLQNGCIWACL